MTMTQRHRSTGEPTRGRPSSRVDHALLSFTQESLWLADRMARQDGPAYNEPVALRIHGRLQAGLLRQALHCVIERHDVLRTRYVETGEGLRTIVQDQSPECVQVYDLRECDGQAVQFCAEELVLSSYSRPFDLTVVPLLRAVILLLPEEECIFALTMHHLITNGWSYGLLLDEIGQHYRALGRSGQLAPLPAPALSYTDYVHTLRQDFERGAFDAGIAYWKARLKDGGDAPGSQDAPEHRTGKATGGISGVNHRRSGAGL